MKLPDLDAPLVAGRSAAGFELGMGAESLEPLLAMAQTLDRPPTPIDARLASGETFVVLNAMRRIATVFFGEEVRLVFNAHNELFCIWVQHGYRGLYLSRFGIGTALKAIDSAHALEFDDGDETYYVTGNLAPGISFCGEGSSLASDPAQRVSAICVHDWSRA